MTDTVPMTLRNLEPRQIGVLTEAKLIEWNIDYSYDPAVAVDGLQRVPTAQVRILEHQFDQDTVDQYATHMREGVTFPPIVLLRDDIVLDGNTRIAAAKQARFKTLAAFKCNFANLDIAVAFAGAMNQMGGRRLAPDEARHQAEVLMRYNFEDDSIARELGYGRTQVNNWRREHEATLHAERTQISDVVPLIQKATLRKLSSIKQDAPFVAAANLIADTKMPAKQVTELINAVQAAPSEAEALKAVSKVREEAAAVGPPPHRVTVPAEVAVVRRLLPQLVNLEGRAIGLVDPDPEKRANALANWIVVRDLATEVVSVYGGGN